MRICKFSTNQINAQIISELRKEHTLCHHGGNPTGQQYEKTNFEQTLPRFRSWESE